MFPSVGDEVKINPEFQKWVIVKGKRFYVHDVFVDCGILNKKLLITMVNNGRIYFKCIETNYENSVLVKLHSGEYVNTYNKSGVSYFVPFGPPKPKCEHKETKTIQFGGQEMEICIECKEKNNDSKDW